MHGCHQGHQLLFAEVVLKLRVHLLRRKLARLPASFQAEAVRLHGALISGQETQAMVQFILDQFPDEPKPVETKKASYGATEFEDIDLDDPLFLEAVKTVIMNKQGSVSLLQRKLGIGYQRAARLIDQLEEAGVVEPYSGSKAREVLVDETFIEKLMAARSLTDSN